MGIVSLDQCSERVFGHIHALRGSLCQVALRGKNIWLFFFINTGKKIISDLENISPEKKKKENKVLYSFISPTLPSSHRPASERPATQRASSPSSVGWRGWGRCLAPAVHGSVEALSLFPVQTGTPAGSCGPPADSLDPDASLLGWHCYSVIGRCNKRVQSAVNLLL